MIGLWQALDCVAGTKQDRPRRALILGAGFSKGCEDIAPLFGEYKPALARALQDLGDGGALSIDWTGQIRDDVTELLERLDNLAGRAALARIILAEPSASKQLNLNHPMDGGLRPVPAVQAAVYRTLKEWAQVVREHRPTHLQPLAPLAPNVVLGRLLAEGYIDEVLSTNWDALIELGVMLCGVCVEDADECPRDAWFRQLPQRMRVFETQDELVGGWLIHGQINLFKLHGGVRTIRRVLDQGPTPESDAALKRSFKLSATDLSRWEGSTSWVQERVFATLRSCATLTLGVSGVDNVMFHAVRTQISDWEEAARRQDEVMQREPASDQAPSPRGRRSPPLVAVNWSAALRLRNMLTFRLPNGNILEPVAQASTSKTVAGLYARFFLELLWDAADDAQAFQEVCVALEGQLRLELDPPDLKSCQNADLGPFTRLLLIGLGFGARTTAAALRLGPFSVSSSDSAPFRRWWTCPYRVAPEQARRRALGEALALIAELLRAPQLFSVDPWSGVITLAAQHPSLALLGAAPDRPLNLLLLPCPWTLDFDWGGGELRQELEEAQLGWGPGQPLDAFSQADIQLLPLGGGPVQLYTPTPRVAGRSAHWTSWRPQ